VEVQFKSYVGGYTPQCQTVKVGHPLPGLPAIPVFEDIGAYCCEVEGCFSYSGARLRFERGVLVEVSPIEWDEEGYPITDREPLPQPRDGRKVERRRAIAAEQIRRSLEAERESEEAREFLEHLGVKPTALAMAMMRPIRRRLDFASIGRKAFVVQPFHFKRVGPYVKEYQGDKWKRREGTRAG